MRARDVCPFRLDGCSGGRWLERVGMLVPIGLPEISAGCDRVRELKDPDRPVRCAAGHAPLPWGSLAIRRGRLRACLGGDSAVVVSRCARATGRCGFADLTKPDPHHTPPAAPPDIASLDLAPQGQRIRGPERGPRQEGRAMFSHAIVLAILTHPLHVLLFGVILSRLAREVVSTAARAREASRVESLG